MYQDRIRNALLMSKIVTAEEAASLIKDGMVVGMSGFTRAGDAKAVPMAMVKHAKSKPFKIFLITGASLGHDLDRLLCEAGITDRRMPFQVDKTLRKAINQGTVKFIDQHLSHTVEQLRSRQLPDIDYAIIEAIALTEDGFIIPTTSVGNSASLAMLADKVIVEINLSVRLTLEGLHDIYIPGKRPNRNPIPIMSPDSRIGSSFIPVLPEKIVAIVINDLPDHPSAVSQPDTETSAITEHLIAFFQEEVKARRLPISLNPIQVGIGAVANAVVSGLQKSPFKELTMYSEVLQDSTFDLIDVGKMDFASGCSIILSKEYGKRIWSNFESYKDKLILRPQEISNHPEVIRRLGVIAINTALEFDIYGNVNSTHVNGTHMMNGIGGSGDFTRNAYLSIFISKAVVKNGAISSIVPMVSHVDHTEHDVSILVTDIGLADLRGLAPRERAPIIIKNCVHPSCREKLLDYFERACHKVGGQTPHLLEEAYAWHIKAMNEGSMH
ncbi:MAG: succinyl-CoA:acetate CoA-transferase [Candidatus Tokpelaia sp. JSC085]|nr:MAG: succinyl-CoA:acetate CoA-transferase [Candidatus Tokpelaia sp. JSC085]